MLSNLHKNFMKNNYVVIDKVYLKNKDIEVGFTNNVYHAFCKLNDYLDFIKKLVKNTRNIRFKRGINSVSLLISLIT